MSKRRQQQDCSNCSRKRRQQKHLYVVLDDIDNGYSIHKLDLRFEQDYSDSEDDRAESETDQQQLDFRRLPEPPALRFALPCCEKMFLAALGTNIFMASNYVYHAQPPALLYDTRAAMLNMGPQTPTNLRRGSVIVAIPPNAPLGGETRQKLYVLACEHHGKRLDAHVFFESMSWTRTPDDAGRDLAFPPTHEWSWDEPELQQILAQAPAPLDGNEEVVTSFAVHPDGHTIFLSTQDRERRDVGTYSFDTGNHGWRSHGPWVLPFLGQGYYDTELDEWVGLGKDGHVCSCQVFSSGYSTAPPDSKRTKDRLLHDVGTDGRRHLGASLTYMGGNSRFCLVECVVRDGENLRDALNGCDGSSLLHVTMFGLKYNRKGELEATSRRATSSYAVSKYLMGYSPVAFWM